MMPRSTRTKSTVSGIETRFYSKILLILILIAAALAIYLLFPRHAQTKSSAPAPSNELVLNVLPLNPQSVDLSSQNIGYITPINSVDLVPNISGYVNEVWVQGGEEVKKGQKLVLIDPDEYKARLDAAKAAVTQAQADFNNAGVYYQRIKKVGAKAISKTEVDNAKAKYLAAQGALAQAKADQALAQVNYDFTLLSAPIDGVVGNVDLTKGNYVSPASEPLFKIIQFDPIRVVFSITDKEYLDELTRHPDHRLFAGEKIKLRLADGVIYSLPGEYKYAANEIDRSTSSIAIYADFPNPSRVLVANAYVDVILERTIPGAYLIPQNFVSLTPDGSFVYTVKNNQLLKTALRIIGIKDNNYVVGNRFAADEYLVVDKVGRIDKNTKIKVKLPDGGEREKH